MGVVVLGSGGKLGRLLAPLFPGPAQWLTRKDVDIYNTSDLRAALKGASAVLCLAGITGGRSEPLEANSDLALRTLDAAQDTGAGRVFLFSSAAVYGRQSGALTENGLAAPVSPYGFAKLTMEQAAAEHAHPNTMLRLGNVAGADAVLGGWRAGFALDTLANGRTPRRSYIGPSRLAQVLSDLCFRRDLPTLMNVTAPGVVEMGALLDAANRAWEPRSADLETIENVALCTKLLEQFTKFQPNDSTAEGIVADWRKAIGENDVVQTNL